MEPAEYNPKKFPTNPIEIGLQTLVEAQVRSTNNVAFPTNPIEIGL